jgi:Rrf2 family protein
MLKFSKKVEYALISMLYMAEQKEGQLTTSRELAETFNIPQELAGKVLQSLAKSGCISSVQGVKGGYLLAKEPDLINLADIIAAVDGPIKVVNCVDEAESCGCDQFSLCNMRNPMETIQVKMMNFLNSVTLRDIKTNYIPYDIGNASAKMRHNVNFIDRTN